MILRIMQALHIYYAQNVAAFDIVVLLPRTTNVSEHQLKTKLSKRNH